MMKHAFLSDPILSAERGENPTVLAKMKSGFAVIGLTQFLPGYCLLLRTPRVTELTDLEHISRNEFLFDMSIIGEAIKKVCNPRRINYSIYGNEAPFLHAHIFPRYEWEPEYNKKNPVWTYPETNWTDDVYQWKLTEHEELMESLRDEINLLMNKTNV